jgi:hypothetical protein
MPVAYGLAFNGLRRTRGRKKQAVTVRRSMQQTAPHSFEPVGERRSSFLEFSTCRREIEKKNYIEKNIETQSRYFSRYSFFLRFPTPVGRKLQKTRAVLADRLKTVVISFLAGIREAGGTRR